MSKARGDKPIQNISDKNALYKQAGETLPDYKKEMEGFLDSLRNDHPGHFGTVEFKLAPLKELGRFQAKVTGDYRGNANQVRDIVRGTFISDNAGELPRIQDALEKRFSVLFVKDNVFNPTDSGLRNYNNNIRMPNGHIVETQIMPSQLWDVKEKSHNFMEASQKIERGGLDISDPKQAIKQIDKENRILQNAAVHETGLNNQLNPNFTPRERAQFTVPFEASKEFNLAVEPAAHMTYGFNKAVSPFLKGAGMVVLGAIPIIGILPNIVEAKELETTLQTAIDNGQVSEDALLAYNTILAGHIAQGADPTVLMGEAGTQASFNDWADRYNVQGDLRESLQPSSLALMLKDGSIYIAQNTDRIPQATLDVGNFAIEQTVVGAGYVMNAVDSAYDYMSGNTADMQDIYDGLPVLESAVNDGTYDLSNIDADPIHGYPMAHDLAQIKTDIVNTQNMIGEINQGTKELFNQMDKAESIDFLQDRIDRLSDRFESNYEQAKLDCILDEVTSYVEQHGEFSTVQSTPLLAVQETDPAANQSWDVPKALAM